MQIVVRSRCVCNASLLLLLLLLAPMFQAEMNISQRHSSLAQVP
jgi:hypothetical protein